MCPPAVVMGAMAVASAAATMYSTNQQNKAIKASADTEAANAQREANLNQQALDEQAQQQDQAAAIQRMQREKEGIKERATLNNAFGNAQGNSINRVFNTSLFNENYDKSMIDYNNSNALSQNYREKQSVGLLANNRIRSSNASRKSATSGLGSGILIANSAINGAASGYSLGKALQGR
ncbi:Uncharacterised protein [Campylobacter hyointestinalis subsp. hyointestinalis]|uniref:Uncharacterized protein n=1 Tax=Campylobacter hyointestinalis subsp. hyointestinalis TaxID=91352 RepID=A0A0S4RC47_CAMHY|nr:hypothetical protein [Campylobacter hyointestinalis]CUU71127.1 Uncharacterised protein [Campylobacter hyointestinalis subsp. hyointestinalis]CUU87676.1 Uncharacterised protein [Campylobacter hyointestinalis subsp. hyointestinalis]